jgi:hypothetical protein
MAFLPSARALPNDPRADKDSVPSRYTSSVPEHRLAFTLLILAQLNDARYCTKVQ